MMDLPIGTEITVTIGDKDYLTVIDEQGARLEEPPVTR